MAFSRQGVADEQVENFLQSFQLWQTEGRKELTTMFITPWDFALMNLL
jgi:hypothetical protein